MVQGKCDGGEKAKIGYVTETTLSQVTHFRIICPVGICPLAAISPLLRALRGFKCPAHLGFSCLETPGGSGGNLEAETVRGCWILEMRCPRQAGTIHYSNGWSQILARRTGQTVPEVSEAGIRKPRF